MEREEIKAVVAEAVRECLIGAQPSCCKYDEFITILVQREERRKKHWEKFQLSLIGGAAMVLLGWLAWIGSVVLEALVSKYTPGG